MTGLLALPGHICIFRLQEWNEKLIVNVFTKVYIVANIKLESMALKYFEEIKDNDNTDDTAWILLNKFMVKVGKFSGSQELIIFCPGVSEKSSPLFSCCKFVGSRCWHYLPSCLASELLYKGTPKTTSRYELVFQ